MKTDCNNRKVFFVSLWAAICINLLLWGQPAFCEEQAEEGVQPTSLTNIPEDALNRGSPRSSLEGFLRSVDKADWESAVGYLDLRNLPLSLRDRDPADLAYQVAVVIQRELLVNLEELSSKAAGTAGDNLPPYQDEIGRIEAGGKEYVLLMQQVPRDDGVNIWKVSNRSVGQAIELYEAFGYGLLANYLSEKLPRVSILGVELFKWVLALAAGFAAYAVSYLLGRSIVLLVSAPASPNYKRLRYFFTVPVGLLVAIFIFNIVLDTLGIGITAQEIARGRTLGIIVLTWVVLSAVGMLRDAYAQRLEHEGKPGAVVLLRPAVNAINVIIVLSALLLWLDNIGFNITTLLAGLGVGSVAVALALQKPLEDIFGALSLYTQQPIRIGDFCRIGSDIGSVEEIGLRATRIRTLANTVVSIPNSKVAAGQIDNISARQMILYSPKLRLRYDTTGEQVQTILRAIRELLRSNEHIVQESPRVRFQEFGDTALILEVFAYVDTTDWAKYLEYAEELNLQILKIINQAGTNLALPVRVLLRGDEDAVD